MPKGGKDRTQPTGPRGTNPPPDDNVGGPLLPPSGPYMPGVGEGPTPTPTPTGNEFPELKILLTRYGLMSLYETAVEWMRSGIGDNPERLEIALRATPEFQQRFAGIFAREAAGMPPISINEYLAYEDQAYQMMRERGFPPGFYDDPSDFATLIGGNVSVNELAQRLDAYADAAAVGREQVRVELARHFQGQGVDANVDALSDGDLAAFFADPERALPSLRSRLAAAQVSSAAGQAGFGALTFDEASTLAGRGLTEDAARQAFAALASQGDVVNRLAGEDDGGLDRATQLGVAAGEAQALTALERARRGRQGGFEGGGSFATGREGISGLSRA